MNQQKTKENISKGKEYELLTMNVYVELLKKYPEAKIELRKKILGKSNTSREIDVYAEIPLGFHTYKTAIECKNYNDTIGIETVDAFLGKLQDIEVDKGILVTKSGYTGPAKKSAREHGLDLIELRKPAEEDWQGRLKVIHIQMQMYYPEIYNIELKTDRKELVGKEMAGLANELILTDENGNLYKDLNQIIQENINNDWTEEQKVANVIFEKLYFLKVNNEKIPVKGFSFKYCFHKTPQEIIIDGERTVELIMKNAFTEEIRTIDKDFKISNSK